MNLKSCPPHPLGEKKRSVFHSTRLIMRLIILLTILSCFKVTAAVYAQQISLSVKDAPIEKVLDEIKKQSGYSLITKDNLLDHANMVTVTLKNASVKQALDECFKNQPFTYELVGKTIVVKPKPINEENKPKRSPPLNSSINIVGKVTDENGKPLPGATVKLKGTNIGTQTDSNGNYELNNVPPDGILLISFTGYESQEIKINGQNQIALHLNPSVNKLDEVQAIGYGMTTQRYSTGSVSKVTSQEISEQPVSNPLLALEGRVAGLSIIQSSGLPGSGVSVQIRGQNSITSGTNPLYIVDGVPYPSVSLDNIYGANAPAYGGASTFNSINPADIESIEVLKDADETAIYGSRGANGVILITTKKGKAGKTKLDVNVNSGAGEVTRMLNLLSPQQYYSLREQAFTNDGVTPTAINAPDLLQWNKNQTTNFEKLLIGNTAHATDATISLSGGSETTTFLLSSTYHHETTVFPGDLGFGRGGVHLNIAHNSPDKKLSVNITASYTSDVNRLNSTDLTPYYNLPPDYPLYNASGGLNWEAGQTNPLAFLQQPYKSETENLMSSAMIQYALLPGLNLRANLGYNKLSINQVETIPSTSQNPAFNPTGSANFATNSTATYLIELQLDYKHTFGKAVISALAGSTLQSTAGNMIIINAYNYASDALLQSASAAGGSYIYNYNSLYKFESLFGRLNVNWDGKYILNGNFRRDGSSRFGPGKQYGNFGSIGAGWIFTEETAVKNNIPWLSFGKLRGSYGTVGNDQISDYGYLSSYNSTNYTYGGSPGIVPGGLANPNFSWEVNKKLEAGLELGFIKDRILLTVDIFRDRSDNQILSGILPSQTGFGTYTANIPAEILNTGIELELNTVNIKKKDFNWSTSFNFTAPKNKLVSWPGLSSSYVANYYVIGQPLTPFILFHSTGVNPQTGAPTVGDLNHDGQISYGLAANGGDQTVAGSIFPSYYGGISNKIRYKNWQLDFLFQYVKQVGLNIISHMSNPIGTMYNTYSGVAGRWQQPGDVTNIPAATATAGTNVYNAYNYYYQSDAALGDASFIRLKNLSLSYNVTGDWVRHLKIDHFRIYLQGQNLLTFTHYLGFDPENSAQSGIPLLPPLKMLTAGFQCTF